MVDAKLSQLSSITSLSNADLLAISKSIAGGNWESKSITAANAYKSFGSSDRTLKVSKSGVRDADNIKDAVALAVALTPTQINPVVINVMPGSYLEDNPISIPEWVSIYSSGGSYSSTIVAANDGNIFVGNGNSSMSRFTIVGSPAYSNVAYKSATTTTGVFSYCVLIDCRTGILCDNGSINTSFIISISLGGSLDKLISNINGGYVLATSCVATGGNCAFYCSGTGSELYSFNGEATGCVNGICADDNGYIDAMSNHIDTCTNAIYIGPTGASHIKAMGCIIAGSVTNDIYVESATSRLAYMGHLDSSKFNIVSGAEVNIVADDDNPDVEGGLITGKTSLQGKVSVGTPGAITLGEDLQVNIGEGSSFVNDKQGNPIVEFWSYDSSAPSGSKFTRFANNAGTQLTGANDAIIVGCKYPFPAIRLNIAIALTTTNYITTEYWNGSTWVDLTARLPGGGVAGYRRSDFAKRGNLIFRNVETQFVECSSDLFSNGDWADANNVLDEIPLWDADEDFYAIRFRNNGVLTSGMTFSDGRVKPHSFMVSTSGQKANFGLYRTNKSLYIDSKLFYPDRVNPPAYVDLQMSTNITYTDNPTCLKSNSFSKVTAAFTIPFDIDTSSPVECYVDGVITTTDTGKDIYSTIYIARINSANPGIVGSLPENEVDQITTVTSNANSFISIIQPLDVSGYNAEDLLLVAFQRNAGADPTDTYGGNFILGDFTFKYKSKFV